MIVRIQNAQIHNFCNVLNGELRFPCSLTDNPFARRADVMGIYGQNGSGKTTFIYVLQLLQRLLAGERVSPETLELISFGKESADFRFEFSIADKNGFKARAVYAVELSQRDIWESLKVSVLENGKWGRMNTIIETFLNNRDTLFQPEKRKKELFGSDKVLDELRVTKLLCAKEARSFIFSEGFNEQLKLDDDDPPGIRIIHALHEFGKRDFFVLTNRYSGLIALDACLPVRFRTESTAGQVLLPIDQPRLCAKPLYDAMCHVIGAINIVLGEIIPGMKLNLKIMGEELLKDGSTGIKAQLTREISASDGTIHQMPLKYESEGIKKIVAFLHLFIAAYNNPSITLAIDELDSSIYEYLLGELLRIMQKSGKGQLIFTSHNLYPLETLQNSSIVFTTTDPNNRYTRLSNVKATNNLRLCYLREAALGGGELYQETDSNEIAHALRKVRSEIVVTEEEDA